MVDKTKMKTVLISVIGTSPAVLTETVWALAHEKTPVIPDEVHVITTSVGREKLERMLLEGKPSVWESMRRALKSEKLSVDGKLRFGRAQIVEIPDEDGNGAADLRTAADNLRAADCMLAKVRAQTENPETVVYASIAGGRKSMSALLLSCMSLLARECDHVNHVLTTPETIGMQRVFRPSAKAPAPETKEFFCYPVKGATYAYREGAEEKKIPAGKIKIELFDVPFVRVRGLFQQVVKEMPVSYGSLVHRVQELAPPAEVAPEVVLDVERGICKIDGMSCKMSATCFGLLYIICKRGYEIADLRDGIEGFQAGSKSLPKGALPKWVKQLVASKRFNPKPGESTFQNDGVQKVLSDLRGKLKKLLDGRFVAMLVPAYVGEMSYDKSRIRIEGEETYPQLTACIGECR